MVLIPNTLELTTMWVTRALAEEVTAHPELTFDTEFLPIPIDDEGELEQEHLFPESHRPAARRAIGRCTRMRGIRATRWLRRKSDRGAEWRSGRWCSIWTG